MSARGVVVAGVASGVGKTSVTVGLLAALRHRGLVTQAFKVGPDFIDPGFHRIVTGRPSLNLDGWMCGADHVRATVARHAAGADVVIVEGVMGCFDGVSAVSDAGSTAEIARWLGLPIVLVVDVSAQARSAAAVVLGFERFAADLDLAGVILNRAGGPRHAHDVSAAISASCRARPLGAIAWDRALTMPERHLGLVTASEGSLGSARIDALAVAVESGVDLAALLDLARPVTLAPPADEPRAPVRARIGVARDQAFQFYYEENLGALASAGAELVDWSPIDDAELPDVDGLYLGGGYPELHAERLGSNAAMRASIRRFAEAGKPIYAECGGLMLLADSLEQGGVRHPMVGLLPAPVTMDASRLTLGYREVTLTRDTPLGPPGTRARGHEFHCSTLGPVPSTVTRAYRVTDGERAVAADGFLVGQALMSYVHLHFGSNPALARSFVGACAAATTTTPMVAR